jgi:hypothetical protein
MNMSDNSWIGVDLDRTLAFYDEFRGEEHIGEPIAPMVERVKSWIADGRDVRVLTARANSPISVAAIQEWCREHIGQPLPVTSEKDYYMICLYDDRAIQVEPNTGVIIGDAQHVVVTPLKELERREIEKAMKVSGGDKKRAAELLGIGRSTLYRRLSEYGQASS